MPVQNVINIIRETGVNIPQDKINKFPDKVLGLQLDWKHRKTKTMQKSIGESTNIFNYYSSREKSTHGA